MTSTISSSSDTPIGDDDILDIVDDRDDVAAAGKPSAGRASWRVLVVDDDPEVHTVTRFALGESEVVGRDLELISVFSAAEGKDALSRYPDIAVVLLDVVMEEHDAGLKFVEWMRAEGHVRPRVILRTGQPGYAPELQVVNKYDINDYRTKGELTQTRLFTAITAAIRTFQQLTLVDAQRYELENFAHALGHDFKQTTRQIKSYSDLIADAIKSNQPTDSLQMLDYLSNAARRLGALVDVLSQYTLLNRPPEITAIDLGDVLGEVCVALDPMIRERGAGVIVRVEGRCLGNAVIVGQVLQILIANGLQYNDAKAPEIDVETEFSDGQCRISVNDNGVGIEAAYLEQIFEPRMRLRSAMELSGTGLGLTLSRRAIEALGGSIWCESAPGEGSTFHVSLPAIGG